MNIIIISLLWVWGKVYIPINIIIFYIYFLFIKKLFNTFQLSPLTFGIERCICIPFGHGIFIIGSKIMDLYGIHKTKYL